MAGKKGTGLWKPGQSGNIKGRAKGSRNRLTERFLTDLHADWEKHGVKTLEEVRKENPSEYLRVVALLVPKQHEVKVPALEELAALTEQQIRDRLQRQYQLLRLAEAKPVSGRLPSPARIGTAGEDEGEDL